MWDIVTHRSNGADFASYYWAWQQAISGGDPYDTAALGDLMHASGLPGGVHPFFYPPPFLLSMAWIGERTVGQAYRLWFWVDVLATVVCVGTLVAWWGRGRAEWRWLALIGFLSLTAVPNNHGMGQVNLPVLAVVLLGLWATERDRGVLGGVLLGIACMAKMSPAFFVAWWLLRGRHRAVVSSCVTAVVLSVLALAVVPIHWQFRFYTEVLPGFGSGDYNGLRVPIALFGNHSIPDVFNSLWPGNGRVLSPTAGLASKLLLVGMVGGLGLLFRGRDGNALARWGQIGAVSIAVLLVPVYTYEHHLVYAIPAMVAVIGATLNGRLPRWTLLFWCTAWLGLCFELSSLRDLSRAMPQPLSLLLQEAKLLSLLTLFVGAVMLGRSGQEPRR